MRLRWFCLSVSFAALACGTSASPPGGAGSGSGSAAGAITAVPQVRHLTPSLGAVKAPPVPLPRQESFELITPGTGARSPLRYALAPGAFEYRTTLALRTRRLAGGVLGEPVPMPAIRDGFAAIATAGEPLQVRALDPVIDGPANEAAEQYIAAARANLKDRRASVNLDERGQLGAIAFNDDPTGARGPAASDELAQRLLTIAVPFPAEPVGAGARWRVITILRQGPLYLKQTATYELVARTPSQVRVKATIVRHGEPQLVADAGLPPDTVADLIALVRTLDGELVVDPTRPFAVGGTLTVESRLHARITARNQPAFEELVEDLGTIELSAAAPAP